MGWEVASFMLPETVKSRPGADITQGELKGDAEVDQSEIIIVVFFGMLYLWLGCS